MKKLNNKNNMVFIVVILVISLLFSVSSIIMNFTSYTYNYSSLKTDFDIDVNAKSATIYSTLNSKGDSFKEGMGPRNISLTYGRNIVPIEIENSNNKITDYTLLINREDDRSSEDRLSNLHISYGKIDFNSDKYTYNIDINTDIKKVSINSSLKSPKAHYVDGYGPREVTLSEGLNVAFIKVKSEAGTEKLYKINIFKTSKEKSEEVDSNYLDSLSLSRADLDFDSQKFEYNVTVANEVDSIMTYAFAKNSKYTTEVSGGDVLNVGDNKIIIKVKNNSNVLSEYVINVKREEPKINKEDETKLKWLEVSGYNIEFKEDVYKYRITQGKNKNIIVSAYPKSESSTVNIFENPISHGKSKIFVSVTSSDKKIQTYEIEIDKAFWTAKNEIIAVIFTFSIGLIIVSVMKYYELKKKNTKVNKAVNKTTKNTKNSKANSKVNSTKATKSTTKKARPKKQTTNTKSKTPSKNTSNKTNKGKTTKK